VCTVSIEEVKRRPLNVFTETGRLVVDDVVASTSDGSIDEAQQIFVVYINEIFNAIERKSGVLKDLQVYNRILAKAAVISTDVLRFYNGKSSEIVDDGNMNRAFMKVYDVFGEFQVELDFDDFQEVTEKLCTLLGRKNSFNSGSSNIESTAIHGGV